MAGEGGSGLPTCSMQVLRSFLLVAGMLVVAQMHHLAVGMKDDKPPVTSTKSNSQTEENKEALVVSKIPKFRVPEEEDKLVEQDEQKEKKPLTVNTHVKRSSLGLLPREERDAALSKINLRNKRTLSMYGILGEMGKPETEMGKPKTTFEKALQTNKLLSEHRGSHTFDGTTWHPHPFGDMEHAMYYETPHNKNSKEPKPSINVPKEEESDTTSNASKIVYLDLSKLRSDHEDEEGKVPINKDHNNNNDHHNNNKHDK